MNYDIYTGLLQAFPLSHDDKSNANFTYSKHHPMFEQLEREYKIKDIASADSDFEKSVNMLNWVAENNYHKGNSNNDINWNSLELLKQSYKKDSENGINCRGLATILTECLLCLGLNARTVYIMPCSPYDGDNHVVTEVFIADLQKWIMLDPTFNIYFTNQQGEPLSLLEMRTYLANQDELIFSDGLSYNGDTDFTDQRKRETTTYFAKNLFYFETKETSEYYANANSASRSIIFCPDNYDVQQMQLSSIKYRMKSVGDDEQAQKTLQGWYNEVQEYGHNFHYSSCEKLAIKPCD